jgi:DNA helicase-2/ATP-dependent DNA helicase PcrA
MARSESRGRPEERALVADLNPAQRRAVLHGRGPLLIIAGAGTGKTKVITHRIARLIAAKAARPDEILAVTFTEKAANEMEARVDCLVPYTSSFAEISTFNSFGERVLRDYALDVGYRPDFRLLAEVDQAVFFRENLFRLPLDYYRPLGQPTRHIQEVLGSTAAKQVDVGPRWSLGSPPGRRPRPRRKRPASTSRSPGSSRPTRASSGPKGSSTSRTR